MVDAFPIEPEGIVHLVNGFFSNKTNPIFFKLCQLLAVYNFQNNVIIDF